MFQTNKPGFGASTESSLLTASPLKGFSAAVKGGPRIADKALATLASSSREVHSAVTVDGLLLEFLVACRAKRLESSTIQFYEGVAKHASAAFGKTRIEALSVRDLEMLCRSMAQKGLSSARVRHVHSLMHRSLNQAVKWGWLEKKWKDCLCVNCEA